MKPDVWLRSLKEIGVNTSSHRKAIHPYIETDELGYLMGSQRVLITFCGRDNMVMWYRSLAAHVICIDPSAEAIEQFLKDNHLAYDHTAEGRYEAEGITFFNSSIFEIEPADIGRIDCVYDRAALVTLPETQRQQYLDKMDALMHPGSTYVLFTLEFQPCVGDTSPFSITPEDVYRYYGDRYIIDHVKNVALPNHPMVEQLNLDFLKKHDFILTKTVAPQTNSVLYFWPLNAAHRA